LTSSEDVSTETRDRLPALAKREQSRAALGHGAEPRHSRREHIAVAVKESSGVVAAVLGLESECRF